MGIIVLIVIIGFLALGIIMLHSYSDSVSGSGIITILIFGVLLIIHLGLWIPRSYTYKVFEAKRNAFEQTLTEARKNNNPYELAAIVKDISDWNIELARNQYDNKTFLFNMYVDDRIETLKPIN